MTGQLNDRYNLNLILAVLFGLGIACSLYAIYSLPDSLRLGDGFESAFLPVYIILGLTFVSGIATIFSAFRYRREIVVFRDRILDNDKTKEDEQTEAGKTTISLDTVKQSLNQSSRKDLLQSAIQTVCKQLDAGQGALYLVQEDDGKRYIQLSSGYALTLGESTVVRFEFGEGLVGQCASVGRSLYIDDIPDGYIKIISGLGSASPRFLLIVPVKTQDQVKGVIELASFTPLSEDQRRFVEESAQLIAGKITSNA